MARTDPNWTEFVAFVRGLPSVVHPLLREWPPLTVVATKPEVELLIPAPGVEGTIQSYREDGRVGVVAPVTVPHPVHGWGSLGREVNEGRLAKALVDPAHLVWVREGRWTRDDVEEALQAGREFKPGEPLIVMDGHVCRDCNFRGPTILGGCMVPDQCSAEPVEAMS
jgi:hypothetical protein